MNEVLKIIANPPFRINRKKFVELLKSADDYVVLHTFKFCNNELGRFELVEYKEWPEVTGVQTAIAASTMENNSIEKPEFYQPEIKDDIFEGCENYIIFNNTHFMDGEYDRNVKQNRPKFAKKLIFSDVTKDAFVCKCNTTYKKAGYKIKRPIYPRSFIKIFEEHIDEIYMDTRMFGNIRLRYPLIRKKLIDDTN